MARSASLSIRWEVSTSRPSTRPASAALASPLPIDSATCWTVTGPSKLRCEPSGRVMTGIPTSSGAMTFT